MLKANEDGGGKEPDIPQSEQQPSSKPRRQRRPQTSKPSEQNPDASTQKKWVAKDTLTETGASTQDQNVVSTTATEETKKKRNRGKKP